MIFLVTKKKKKGQLFLHIISTFKPPLHNYEPNDIFLFKSVKPFLSFCETNEQQLIFINNKKKTRRYNKNRYAYTYMSCVMMKQGLAPNTSRQKSTVHEVVLERIVMNVTTHYGIIKTYLTHL